MELNGKIIQTLDHENFDKEIAMQPTQKRFFFSLLLLVCLSRQRWETHELALEVYWQFDKYASGPKGWCDPQLIMGNFYWLGVFTCQFTSTTYQFSDTLWLSLAVQFGFEYHEFYL